MGATRTRIDAGRTESAHIVFVAGACMTSYARPLLAVVILCAAQHAAAAQSRSTWSVQGSVLYTGLHGDVFDGVDAGAGFELQARRKLSPYWSLGCGVQTTYHAFEAPFTGTERQQGIFCEPRRLIDVGRENIFPYLLARAAFLRQRVENDDTVTGTAHGAALDIGGGVVLPIANTAGNYPTLLEIGASAGYSHVGSFKARSPAVSVTRESGNGWDVAMRLGLSIGLPFGSPRR